jgi:hypothetical protein
MPGVEHFGSRANRLTKIGYLCAGAVHGMAAPSDLGGCHPLGIDSPAAHPGDASLGQFKGVGSYRISGAFFEWLKTAATQVGHLNPSVTAGRKTPKSRLEISHP